MNPGKIGRFLKLPLPYFFESKSSNLLCVAGISAYTMLFMYLYKPFNVLREDLQEFQLLSYFGITFFVNILIFLILKGFWKDVFKSENGTVGKYLLHNTLLLIAITIAIFFYDNAFIYNFNREWSDLIRIQRNVFLTGLFPIIFIYGILRTRQLKRNLISHNIKPFENSKPIIQHQIHRLVNIQSETSESLSLNTENLLYAEADNNYSIIYWLENEELQQKLLRLTLKNLETQLPAEVILRCHRSFLINKDKIARISGTLKTGHKIHVKGISQTIPLSRSHYKEIVEAQLA